MGPLTIDASVFGRAINPGEEHSEESERLVRLLGEKELPLVLPTLAKIEIVAAVRRGTGNPDAAADIARRLERMPGMTFVPLDDRLIEEAIELVLETSLGGADSVYVAVARRYDAALISLDKEQIARVPEGVRVLSPGDALAELEDR